MISLFEQVRKIVSECLNINLGEIKPESLFIADLGADSLALIDLITILEEKFAIEIPDEDAAKLQKINDVIKYIEQRVQT